MPFVGLYWSGTTSKINSIRSVETPDIAGFNSNQSSPLWYAAPGSIIYYNAGVYCVTLLSNSNYPTYAYVFTVFNYRTTIKFMCLCVFSCTSAGTSICEIYYDSICDANPPCKNGGTCVPLPQGYYMCQCMKAWIGQNCQTCKFKEMLQPFC
jgi:hypothetical protein